MLITVKVKKDGDDWSFVGQTQANSELVSVKVILADYGLTLFEGSVAEGIALLFSKCDFTKLGKKATDEFKNVLDIFKDSFKGL